MRIGNRNFDLENECYIMGILNVTPDSFSDGGKWNSVDAALRHAEEMIAEGAGIIDIGGESTRPGHEQISDEEEIARVVPAISEIKKRFDVPISLDTYKSSVAAAGINAGADLINDIWGCRYETLVLKESGNAGCEKENDADDRKTMAEVIAQADVPCVLMHNRPVNRDCDPPCAGYDDFLCDVKKDLAVCAHKAIVAGVDPEKIILDPGIGFGKTLEQNLQLMNNLDIMNEIGSCGDIKTDRSESIINDISASDRTYHFPWLLGTSRKSMIGLTLDLPADQRLEGTLVTTVLGVLAGCSIVRVHDVKENLRAVRMTQAIMRAQCG